MRTGKSGCARPALSERTAAIGGFLAAAGWPAAEVTALAADASFRHYLRVRRNGTTAVLMDAPPQREDVRPFLRIARHLCGLGLSAPAILAADEAAGLLLLEDLGDDTFTRLLAAGADEPLLYRMAVDVLIHLHRLPAAAAVPAGLPAYDRGRLLDEALLLVDWFLPAVAGCPVAAGVRDDYIAAWKTVLAEPLAQPPTLVLRDFHVDNLMRVAGRTGIAACGLLDFQDAVAGPAAYDLMSLLEDARRDVPAPLREAMRARYLAGVAPADPAAFARSFAILAAQRHAKVIGIFTRLDRRDGKPGYLVHIPRVWRLLAAAVQDPALAAVRDWLDQHIPPHLRCAPQPAPRSAIAPDSR